VLYEHCFDVYFGAVLQHHFHYTIQPKNHLVDDGQRECQPP
jgi:hypothetical protein